MFVLLGPETTFMRNKSVCAIKARHYISYKGKCPCYDGQMVHLLGQEVSLLLGPDTICIRKDTGWTLCLLGTEVSLHSDGRTQMINLPADIR